MKLVSTMIAVSALATLSLAQSDTSSSYASYSSTSYSASLDTDSRFGLFAALGYGFPVGGRYLGDSELSREAGGDPVEEEDHFINVGQGMKIEAGVSYRFLERVRARVGVQFSGGVPRVEIVEENPARVTTENYRWAMWGIKALVVPRFEVLELLDMYTGAGLGVFFTSASYNVTRTGGLTAQVDFENSPTIGFLGLFGVDFPIADNIVLFGELNLEAMRVTTREARIHDSDFDHGEYRAETIYYEDDATDREPRPRTPGTNVALRAGVRFDLF
jgi:opacity protein-like surface antigen